MDHRYRVLHVLAPRPDRVPLAGRTKRRPEPTERRGASARFLRLAGCSSSTGRWACGSSPVPMKPAEVASPGRTALPRCRPTSMRSVPERSVPSGSLNDSKQQTHEARAELFPIILRLAAKVVVVSRCAPGIDARGLHKTNLAASARRADKGRREGCICLSDGFPVRPTGHDQRAVVDGDAKSAAIAAASVIAKETRDRYKDDPRRHHPSGMGVRRSTWRFEPRSIVRRSSGSSYRRCTAGRFSRWRISSLRSTGSERALEVVEADAAARRRRAAPRSRRTARYRRTAGRSLDEPLPGHPANLGPLEGVHRLSGSRRSPRARRVFTSQNADAAFDATMSSSPQRVR